ncbi:MAG: N-acetylglucosamine-6-phosphate deacetylase [Erysipelotrichaceae bacterium]
MILQSKRVWIASQFVEAQIEIAGEKVVGIYPYGQKPVDQDYGSDRVVPGFIEVHSHGAYGFDTNDANPKGLRDWLARIPEEGVTAVLPTTVTQSEAVLLAAVSNVKDVVEAGYQGAHVLGIHFEGPYLDLKYKGAQPQQHIVNSNVEQFIRYQEACNHMIKLITMAPEHDENYALTKYCAANNVVVSLGHSSASYDEAVLAVANGAKSMTHIFNGMTPFNHREPGLIGSAFRFHDVYGEVIADCVHSHPSALNTLFATKGKDYTIMVSDSLRAKGCPKGIYSLGGNDFEVRENGSAYLLESGNLAGSTLRMNAGLKNLVERALVPFEAAINSITSNPARMLRVDDVKGKIGVGFDADLVVLNDNYDVLQTYCRGTASLEEAACV